MLATLADLVPSSILSEENCGLDGCDLGQPPPTVGMSVGGLVVDVERARRKRLRDPANRIEQFANRSTVVVRP